MFDSATRNLLASFVARSRRLLCGEYNKPGGEITSLLQTYGIQPDGTVAKLESLPGLDQRGYEVATTLRELLAYKRANSPGAKAWGKYDPHVYDLIQEQAFTVLNRLCALRMAEERGILPYPVVSKGMSSDGFELYEMSADKKRLSREERYESFLFSIFDELSLDLQVLFDRFATESLLFPRPEALAELLAEINAPALASLWSEDETIGWVYQYWNSKEERKAMRDASAAPRNSRELAVRNQFFTPRYVVEFLTDNTLGRIWYEMTKCQTRLAEQCRYLVRRPNEIFLRSLEDAYRGIYGNESQAPDDLVASDAFAALYQADPKPAASGQAGFFALAGGALSEESFQAAVGERWEQHGNECIDELRRAILEDSEHPKKSDLVWGWAAVAQFTTGSQIGIPDAKEATAKLEDYFRSLLKSLVETEGLTQEELLRRPVLIPHRPLKDPREIRLLDPACGSMHFGLYAFDLFETIYEEAWDNGSCPALQEAYASRDEFLQDVPRLIIEHNIHGIDIDPRAVQIAGLSLWLRAQKAWQARGVKPADRPRVRRSNIVCAEPMPGSPEMLEEFVATLDPPLLGELVKTVFDKMQLAGEAGSLLKIEEEIRTAIDTARKEWLKQQDDLLTRKDGSQEEFFATAEQQVIDALRAYAEQADADSYQRRLFADDAARGFAFIDLCRKRYDAVVMNPPFGEWCASYKKEAKKSYPNSFNDILAAFVERGGCLLFDGGNIGAITSRTCFFLSSFTKWREQIVLGKMRPKLLVDIGHGVMDSAMVEAAAYVLTKQPDESGAVSCFRLLGNSDPALGLLALMPFASPEELQRSVFIASPTSFKNIPTAPFAYWVGHRTSALFTKLPPLQSSGRRVERGLFTGDDFRFIRLYWELAENFETWKHWGLLSKGGAFARYYSDVYLAVNRASGFAEIHASIVAKYTYLNGNSDWVLHPECSYGRSGLTYPLRTTSEFSVRCLPQGCYWTNKGISIFENTSEILDKRCLLAILAMVNSSAFRRLLDLRMAAGDAAARSYEEGVVAQMPWPNLNANGLGQFSRMAAEAITCQQIASLGDETAHAYVAPDLFRSRGASLMIRAAQVEAEFGATELKIEKIQREIDAQAYIEYGIDANQRDALEVVSFDQFAGATDATKKTKLLVENLTSDLLSFFFGTAFGRWDIRYATGERQPPELPDPFDPLPVCPPGMLQNAEGLPAEPKDVPADYPLRISWPGILVDDASHPEDIVARVREAIEVIWKDRAEAIEQEACGILGVKTLRDYFRRPAAFFADHLKRYSKSRRQAPIYWPLSTASGSYTLWLYYHRLTPDTLFACVTNFVAPKQEQTERTLARLGLKNPRTAAEEKEYEAAAALVGELATFRAELERLAKIWKPNLNDGVQITAAPLWSLFRLAKWQKTLQDTWKQLEKGDFDWAHLALSLRPERVIPKCAKDRSLAIAHGFDEALWEEVTEKKGKRTVTTWKPRKDAAETVARLVAERTGKA